MKNFNLKNRFFLAALLLIVPLAAFFLIRAIPGGKVAVAAEPYATTQPQEEVIPIPAVVISVSPQTTEHPIAELLPVEQADYPGIQRKFYVEGSDDFSVTAAYPETESAAVNDIVSGMISTAVESFKAANGRHGTLDIRYSTYYYNEHIIGFAFTETELVDGQTAISVKTAMFDLMGGVPIEFSSIFGGASADILSEYAKITVSDAFAIAKEAGFPKYVFDDKNVCVVLDTAEGAFFFSVPLSEFGADFHAEEYINKYWGNSLTVAEEPIDESPAAPAVSDRKRMALTFDDGPHPLTTPYLLDGLKNLGAKATFFVLGHRLSALSDLVKREVADGHDVGSHTFNHLQLTKLTREKVAEQIDMTSDLLFDLTDRQPSLLRPPYGDRNANVRELCADRGLGIIIWDVDTEDWKTKDPVKIKNNIVSHAHDGAIILLHDIYQSSVEGALLAVEELTAEGFEFLTVTELIEAKTGEVVPGGVYRNCEGTVSK
ncbi:peptidoglycan-N-acetylmuramic acid deacetylase PdaC [Clostridia bacterium]|nr:peptidoglycan-N-acetylmuramic acid deacetylase PdaC [Clostridia bacterium]